MQLEVVTTDPASNGEADAIKAAATKIVFAVVLRASIQLEHPEMVNMIIRPIVQPGTMHQPKKRVTSKRILAEIDRIDKFRVMLLGFDIKRTSATSRKGSMLNIVAGH